MTTQQRRPLPRLLDVDRPTPTPLSGLRSSGVTPAAAAAPRRGEAEPARARQRRAGARRPRGRHADDVPPVKTYRRPINDRLAIRAGNECRTSPFPLPTSRTDCFRRLLKTYLFARYWCIQRFRGSNDYKKVAHTR